MSRSLVAERDETTFRLILDQAVTRDEPSRGRVLHVRDTADDLFGLCCKLGGAIGFTPYWVAPDFAPFLPDPLPTDPD